MSVWKRLQRVGKKAAKFEFTVSYHELTVECSSPKWVPQKLAVNWTRRSRCIRTKHLDWVANPGSSTSGYVDWRLPENVRGLITLYHDAASPQFDDKDWTFVVEKHEKGGRFKAIASQKVNMREYVSLGGAPKRVKLSMKSCSDKYNNVALVISISSALVKEGMATDEDMQSIASLMSAGPADVGNMADFDDEGAVWGSDDGGTGRSQADVDSESLMRVDTMSQLTALTAEISKLTLPAGSQFIDAGSWSVSFGVPANGDAERHGRVLLPSSSAAALRGREGSVTRDMSATAASAISQTDKKPSAAAPTSLSVERPFYSGTPPSTPPEERKAVAEATPARSITPPPLVEPDMTNLNNTSSLSDEGTLTGVTSVRKNPSEDLLNWAKSVTAHYKNIKVTNFTTSWRNGLAFCAVIHHFRPDLIDYGSLAQADVRVNNKLAFDTGALLGIDKILEPSDMIALKVPDKLQVMTYVHAMRSCLDTSVSQEEAVSEECAVESQPSADGKAEAVLLGCTKYVTDDTDSELDAAVACQVYGKELMNQHSRLFQKPSLSYEAPSQPVIASCGASSSGLAAVVREIRDEPNTVSSPLPAPSDGAIKDAAMGEAGRSRVAASSVPAKAKENMHSSAAHQLPKPEPKKQLMTRKQLLNPFDSDDDDDEPGNTSGVVRPASPVKQQLQDDAASILLATAGDQKIPAVAPAAEQLHRNTPRKTPGLNAQDSVKRDELKERARQLIEKARQEASRAAAEAQGQGRGTGAGTSGPVGARQSLRERAQLILEQMSAECTTTSAAAVADTSPGDSPVLSQSKSIARLHLHSGSAKIAHMKDKGYQFYQFSRKEPEALLDTPAASASLTAKHTATGNTAHAKALPAASLALGTGPAHHTKESMLLIRPCMSSAITEVASRLKDGPAAVSSGPTEATHKVDLKTHSTSRDIGCDDHFLDASEYVHEELAALEKEQLRLDSLANKMEVALRRAMDGGDEEREEKLTRQWFALVNRKHELIRRQAELNILNKEHDLERRYDLLNRELRHMMTMDDWQKTQSQRHREALLLAELVGIVNKRDELVRAVEEQQNALESDHELEKAVHALPIPKEKSCCIQ